VRGVNWYLAIIAPKSDFAAATRLAASVSAAAAVLLIVLMIFIVWRVMSKIILTPMKRLGEAAKSMAAGEIDVPLDFTSDDEIGALFSDFSKVREAVKSVISSVTEMSERHSQGHTGSKIDENDFSGAYREVVTGVNTMAESITRIILDTMNCLEKFSTGDFEARFPLLPGDHIRLTQAFETFKENLNSMRTEINMLARNAADGDLSVRINSGAYMGGWSELADSLNRLIEAVAAPISEAVPALERISRGELNVSISGDYRGDFAKIKSSVNGVSQELLAYIEEISSVLGKIAAKDLSAGITRDYLGDFGAIKESINTITASLNMFVSEIQSTADQVNAGAARISQSGSALASGASDQTRSIDALIAAASSINSQASESAEHAATVDALSGKARDNTIKGNRRMEDMMRSMESIKAAAGSISKIIDVIDDISARTNLLALNAAVEASRAGQSGKGFAVVAGEVRDLSQKSKSSANEIRTMIEDSIKKISEGMSLADSSSEALKTVLRDVNEVSSLISGISKLSAEQASSISNINTEINQIAGIAANNSAASEESAEAARELSRQSEALTGLISEFILSGAMMLPRRRAENARAI
jgi:methyl-accepting chemotaxis protein